MGKQEQKGKKGKNRRRDKALTSRYRNERMPVNMCKKAIRVFKRLQRFAERRQDPQLREDAERNALAQAKRCSSAHGPAVEAGLARYFRGEQPFKREKVMKGQSITYRQSLSFATLNPTVK